MMSVDLHRQAMELSGEADMLDAIGQRAEAQRRYRQAAEYEVEVFAGVPASRPRTKGIVALSAVSLFRRARATDEAIRHAHQFLASATLPQAAQEQLVTLLLAAYQERQATQAGRTLSLRSFLVSLRGPVVQYGLAPLDLVVMKMQQLERLVERAGEFAFGLPFRSEGAVSEDVIDVCRTLVRPPAFGSYQFEVRLDSPKLQLPLPLYEAVRERSADDVATSFATIVRDVSEGDVVKLENHVPDPQYRLAFLRLVRQLAPSGRGLSEVEIRGTDGQQSEPAVLNRATGQFVKPHIDVLSSKVGQPADQIRVGRLRGVHLDNNWIELSEGGNTRGTSSTPSVFRMTVSYRS